MPAPDHAGIPDVVAEVNGTKTAKAGFEAAYEGQFQQVVMQLQMTGEEINQDLPKEGTVENIVGTNC